MAHADITISNPNTNLNLDTSTPDLPFPLSKVEIFSNFARITFSEKANVFSSSERITADNNVNIGTGCSLYATILPDIAIRVQVAA